MFFGNEIAAGSFPLTGVVSLLFGFLACLAGVDIFASGGFWSLGRSEEFLISEIRDFFLPLVTFRSRAVLETLELRLSLRRGKDWE